MHCPYQKRDGALPYVGSASALQSSVDANNVSSLATVRVKLMEASARLQVGPEHRAGWTRLDPDDTIMHLWMWG